MQLRVNFMPWKTAGAFAALSLSLIATAVAQDGYRVTQGETNVSDTGGNSGPVRMARIAYIQGGASWRTDSNADWSSASTNLPLRQGSSVSVNNGSRAEIQFDDGSRLRLGAGTVVTMQTLYSDANGEFTELKLNTGLASLTLVSKISVYQVDTPLTSIKAQGPANIRVGISKGVEVAVRKGRADCQGSQGTVSLNSGQYVNVDNGTAALQIADVPQPDNWDNFNDNRDASYNRVDPYLPTNVAIMSGNLSNYGDWRANAHYGHIWHPRGMSAGWRPYHDGHWVWVDPFGWTWVGQEAWGWAPYHYGSWIHDDGGWGWAPGPRQQGWSPAVVSFSTYNGAVAWVPLAPSEIVYQSGISFGFRSGDWALSFAIGGATSYYPGGDGYVVGRPWTNGYVNRSFGGYNGGRIAGLYAGGFAGANNRFQPTYGRSAFALSLTTTAGFGGSGHYRAGTAADAAFFQRGHSFGAGRGAPTVFGPANVRPTRSSFTTSRSFGAARPSNFALTRSVFRSPLSAAAMRHSAPMGRSMAPSSRPAAFVRVQGRGRPNGTNMTRGNSGANSSFGQNRAAANANRMIKGRPAGVGQALRGRPNTMTGQRPGRSTPVRANGNVRGALPKTQPNKRGNQQARPASGNRTSTPQQRRATPQQRSAPQQRRAAPQQRSAPQQRRATPQQRSAPQQRRAAPQQRSAPQQRRAAPQQRSAPQQRRAAPQQRSAPQQRRAAPQQRSAPQQRRAAPQQRSAPQQRRAAPQQKRSAPPRANGGGQKKKGGG